MNIFDCLKPEYFERKKPKKRKIKKSKVSIPSPKNENRVLQGLKMQQDLLNKLLSIENPSDKDIKRIKKIQKRINRKLDKGFDLSVHKPKKYKNKIVRKLKPSQCPKKYDLYIKSAFWEERKNKYYQTYLKMCTRCGSKKFVSLHHKKYDNEVFGHEPDNQLCPLCNTCHTLFHEKYGVKTDMMLETDLFVANIELSTTLNSN